MCNGCAAYALLRCHRAHKRTGSLPTPTGGPPTLKESLPTRTGELTAFYLLPRATNVRDYVKGSSALRNRHRLPAGQATLPPPAAGAGRGTVDSALCTGIPGILVHFIYKNLHCKVLRKFHQKKQRKAAHFTRSSIHEHERLVSDVQQVCPGKASVPSCLGWASPQSWKEAPGTLAPRGVVTAVSAL